jgi:hypothetical protein
MTVGGLLLFTGTEALLDNSSSIIELLSKFGVIAVLWYWLKDLKDQLKSQLTEFRGEAKEIREHYDKILESKSNDFKDYQDRIDKIIKEFLDENNNN